MSHPQLPGKPSFWPRFRSPMRSTAVTARLGRLLGISFSICFLTGLLSHYQYQPWSWLPQPASPVWGYRLTQGIHITTGTASIPLLLASAGLLLGLFGVFRLLTEVPLGNLLILALWLVGAIVIHDGVLSPIIVAIGWTITRVVPPRARRHLQAALVTAALVTVVAVPMVYRQESTPTSKALLQQNFGGNLTVLLAIIAAASLMAHATRVAHDGPGKERRGHQEGPVTG